MDKIKALVVDDKRIIGDLFDFILGYSGHAIKVVHNGTQALEAIQKEKFDIAFLDIIMPETDGIQLLEQIKGVAPDLPIVMMSGYSVEDKRSQLRELGAVTCLNKPFELEDVRKVIKVAIGKDI
jgi:two-component system response regulator (stage 0 sporulation protein F)